MKNKSIETFIVSLAVLSSSAFANTVEDLKLECGGEYKVLESKKYYVDNSGTRAPSYFGNQKKIEVTNVFGVDCNKLKIGYGLEIKVGEVIVLGKPNTSSKLVWLGINHGELGNVIGFNVEQNFTYKTKKGELPLFPLIHEEFVSFLGKKGKANVSVLYGTQNIKEIDDFKKLEIVENVLKEFKWGKLLDSNNIGYYNEIKLDLILKLLPSSEDAQKEYLSDMLLAFKNSSTSKTSFVSFDHRIAMGYMVNKLLNKYGETKYGSSKLEVWKNNPIFFAGQLVSWVFSEVDKAPIMNELEVEEYLEHALDMSKKLKEVQSLYEARILLKQYKNSVVVIKKHSRGNNLSSVHYKLTAQATIYIEKILKL